MSLTRTSPVVHILLCHSPDAPGAKTANGWSERQLAADVNGCLFGRLTTHKITVWQHEQDLLARRIRILKKAMSVSPNQIAVEVHFNSFPDPKTRGFMTLGRATSVHSMRLATCIHDQIQIIRPDAPDLGVCGCSKDRRFVGTPQEFKQTRLALLEDVPQWVCIPEPATLSNPDDTKWVLKFDNRRRLGYAIATGILEFIDTLTLEV